MPWIKAEKSRQPSSTEPFIKSCPKLRRPFCLFGKKAAVRATALETFLPATQPIRPPTYKDRTSQSIHVQGLGKTYISRNSRYFPEFPIFREVKILEYLSSLLLVDLTRLTFLNSDQSRYDLNWWLHLDWLDPFFEVLKCQQLTNPYINAS